MTLESDDEEEGTTNGMSVLCLSWICFVLLILQICLHMLLLRKETRKRATDSLQRTHTKRTLQNQPELLTEPHRLEADLLPFKVLEKERKEGSTAKNIRNDSSFLSTPLQSNSLQQNHFLIPKKIMMTAKQWIFFRKEVNDTQTRHANILSVFLSHCWESQVRTRGKCIVCFADSFFFYHGSCL